MDDIYSTRGDGLEVHCLSESSQSDGDESPNTFNMSKDHIHNSSKKEVVSSIEKTNAPHLSFTVLSGPRRRRIDPSLVPPPVQVTLPSGNMALGVIPQNEDAKYEAKLGDSSEEPIILLASKNTTKLKEHIVFSCVVIESLTLFILSTFVQWHESSEYKSLSSLFDVVGLFMFAIFVFLVCLVHFFDFDRRMLVPTLVIILADCILNILRVYTTLHIVYIAIEILLCISLRYYISLSQKSWYKIHK